MSHHDSASRGSRTPRQHSRSSHADDDYDRAAKPRSHHGDDYDHRRPAHGNQRGDDGRHASGRDRPRPSKRDTYDASDEDGDADYRSSRHRKDPYEYAAEPPRRKDTVRDYPRENDMRRTKTAKHYDNDSDEYYYGGRPRSGRKYKDDDHDRGYRSEGTKHRTRDDHDKGYRTDGREDHERRRERDDRPRDRDRDHDRVRDRDHHQTGERNRYRDEHDDRKHREAKYDTKKHEKHGHEKHGHEKHGHDKHGHDKHGNKIDFSQLMETGQKHWKTVAPMAKPLVSQMAKAYLEGQTKR